MGKNFQDGCGQGDSIGLSILVTVACDDGSAKSGTYNPIGLTSHKATLEAKVTVPEPSFPPGTAWLSCDYDYDGKTGVALRSANAADVSQAANRCVRENMIHLYYNGEITPSFARLMREVPSFAEENSINVRILELTSAGGDVDAAMSAGDQVSDASWTVWTQKNCYSACVFLVAAADTRSISGKIGVHRIIPSRSSASTADELHIELKEIIGISKEYFQNMGLIQNWLTL